jgi:plastocyanin
MKTPKTLIHNTTHLFVLLLIVPVLFLSGCNSKNGQDKKAGTQSDTITIKLTLKDYAFKPDTLRIPAGKPVKIILKNTGDAVHEFMAGKGGVAPSGMGFKQDLFRNIKVHNHGGVAMIMHSSYMIDVKPGKHASISFTLPESKKGTYQMGCFVEFNYSSKTHYDKGMKGVVIVE